MKMAWHGVYGAGKAQDGAHAECGTIDSRGMCNARRTDWSIPSLVRFSERHVVPDTAFTT